MLLVAQRLALHAHQARHPHEPGAWRASPKPGCRSSMSIRSAARTNWCSTARRSCSIAADGWRCSFPPGRRRSTSTMAARRRTAGHCEPGPLAVVEEGDEAAYLACVLGLRDYVDKNGFPGVRAGAVRRHRLRAVRRDGRRRARAEPRALRDAALPLHLGRVAERRRRLRRRAGRALRHRADRRARRGLRASPWRRCSTAAPPTSPRKTCNRACAARC